LSSFSENPGLQYFIGSAVIIFFLGLKDDILLISPVKKFLGQFIAAFLLVYPGHFQLTSLHGFLGLTALNPVFSLLFSFITILVVVNAFNLIDGVDGLAGTLGLVSTLFFGVVFAIEKDFSFAILSFSMAASLLAFLFYNFSKIFLLPFFLFRWQQAFWHSSFIISPLQEFSWEIQAHCCWVWLMQSW